MKESFHWMSKSKTEFIETRYQLTFVSVCIFCTNIMAFRLKILYKIFT